MKTDAELAKTFKLEIDPDGILNLVFYSEERDPQVNKRQAQMVIDSFFKIFNEAPEKKFDLLVDMSPIESANYVSDEARDLYLKAGLNDHIGNAAIVSTSILLKVFILFIAQALGKSDTMKLFPTREEALAWIKSSS